MTEFWFIRHGESESNAGLVSESDQTTPLTEKGRLQAQYVAEYINKEPDFFVVSPYLRTHQTAEPTRLKYPTTPFKTWPIQEFSYLSHQLYKNTNSEVRGKLSRNYFKQANPDLVLGEGGESFNQFIQRIEDCLNRLTNASEERIILFGHGWFMRATLWHLFEAQPDLKERKKMFQSIQNILPSFPFVLQMFKWSKRFRAKKMFSFLIFSAGVQIPNGGILKFASSTNGISLEGFELSHMPASLIETTWINR